jgi:hypothetical protein
MMITPERAGPGAAVQWNRVCEYSPMQIGYKRIKIAIRDRPPIRPRGQ